MTGRRRTPTAWILLGFKAYHAAATLGAALLLARALGVGAYGSFAIGLAWVTILAVPAGMGFGRLLTREVAAALARGQHARVAGLVRWSAVSALGTSAVLLAVATPLAYALTEGATRAAVLTAFLIVPLGALMRVRLGILQGLQRTWQAYFPEFVLFDTLLLATAAGFLLSSMQVSAADALLWYAGISLVSLACGLWLVRRHLPAEVRNAIPERAGWHWLRASFPLMLYAGIWTLNSRIDVLLLGHLAGPVPAGLYDVAFKGAQVVQYVDFAISNTLAPRFARLYALGDREAVARAFRRSRRTAVLGTLALALPLLIFSSHFLVLFGGAFDDAVPVLRILVVAQVINAAFGPVGTMLVMSGQSRAAAWCIAGTLLLSVVLNLALIPRFGAAGAAYAAGTGLVLRNVLFAYSLRRIPPDAAGPSGPTAMPA